MTQLFSVSFCLTTIYFSLFLYFFFLFLPSSGWWRDRWDAASVWALDIIKYAKQDYGGKKTFKVLLKSPVQVHVLYMKVKKMNINKTVAAEV